MSTVLDLTTSSIEDFNKKFGPGAAGFLDGKNANRVDVPYWVSTGDTLLDANLGGGLPGGRVIHVFGPEASGKTARVLEAMAQLQAIDGVPLLFDTENALSKSRMKISGVNPKKVLYGAPTTIEEVFNQIDWWLDVLIKKGVTASKMGFFWDSVDATPTDAELKGDMEDHTVGSHARACSKGFRMIINKLARTGSIMVCISQLKEKIGGSAFANKDSMVAERPLKFYSSIRLKVNRVETLKEGDTRVGIKIKTESVKNKVFDPFRIVETPYYFKRGFDDSEAIFELLKKSKVLTGGGGKYKLKPFENVSITKDNFAELMEKEKFYTKVMESVSKLTGSEVDNDE